MQTLKELINYLKNRNISYKLTNDQVIINRINYDYYLINAMTNKNQIDVFYLDSTMVFYINQNININQ